MTCISFFELICSFLVTFLGVLAAFQLDRWWERRRDRDEKRRLVLALLDEIYSLKELVRNNDGARTPSDEDLEISILKSTAERQVNLLASSELLKCLHILKLKLKKIERYLSVLNQGGDRASKVVNNWPVRMEEMKNILWNVRGLLAQELPASERKELAEWNLPHS